MRRWGKIKESRKNYFDSGFSLSRSGVEGATVVEEREETADAAGVVGDGATCVTLAISEASESSGSFIYWG